MKKFILALSLGIMMTPAACAQESSEGEDETLNAAAFNGFEFRSIGPALTSGRIGDIAVHRFRASGTFLSGMPGGPKTPMPDTTLRAAVFESEAGNVFVRFVAPTGLSMAHAAGFDAMVDSVTRR